MSTDYSNSSVSDNRRITPPMTVSGKNGHPNVAAPERIVSGIAGAALAAYALSQKEKAMALPLGVVSGFLLYRSATGNCPAYTALRTGTSSETDSKIAVIPAGQGIKITKALIIQKSVAEVYAFWRDFSNLPQFMDHLQSVEILDDKHSIWTAKAPLGQTVSWHAEILSDEPDYRIVWRSVEPADIPNAGSVRFEPQSDGNSTKVIVTLEYNPPAGTLGALVAKLFGEEPGIQVEEDLLRFKQLMETGGVTPTNSL